MNGEYSNDMKKYFEILNKNRIITADIKPTHYSLGEPLGKYDFSKKKDKLLEIYNKVAFEQNNNLYLIETHLLQGPIVIDIDIGYSNINANIVNHIYSNRHIEQLISIYNKSIR